jgi:hypothetical protein
MKQVVASRAVLSSTELVSGDTQDPLSRAHKGIVLMRIKRKCVFASVTWEGSETLIKSVTEHETKLPLERANRRWKDNIKTYLK